jgi:hypothetical protein
MGGPVDLTTRHDCPDDPRHLVGHGHRSHPDGLARKQVGETSIHDLGLVPGAPDQRCCADNQEFAQVFVAYLGDAAEFLLAAAGILKRCQAEPGCELPTRAELAGIGDRQVRGGGPMSKAKL